MATAQLSQRFADRGELTKLVNIVNDGVRVKKNYSLVLVGPRGCGKTELLQQAIYNWLDRLALKYQLDYAGVFVRATSYAVGRGVELPQMKTAEAVALRATLLIKSFYELSKFAVDQIGVSQVETLDNATWELLHKYLYERLLKNSLGRALIAVALDGVDFLTDKSAILSIVYDFTAWARELAQKYGAWVIAIVSMRAKTYYKLRNDLPGNIDVKFMLGFTLDDFWNHLFPHVVEDEEGWLRRGGPEPYEAWTLTGGLPRLFYKLYNQVMRAKEFKEGEFITSLDEDFEYAKLLRQLRNSDLLRRLIDVVQSPDKLTQEKYVYLRDILVEKELVVPIGHRESSLILGHTLFGPSDNIGKHYVWVVPALRDYLFDVALRNYVEDMRNRARIRLSL